MAESCICDPWTIAHQIVQQHMDRTGPIGMWEKLEDAVAEAIRMAAYDFAPISAPLILCGCGRYVDSTESFLCACGNRGCVHCVPRMPFGEVVWICGLCEKRVIAVALRERTE
jgi:hypothetical protein